MKIPDSASWIEQARYVVEHSTCAEIVVDMSAVQRIRSQEINELIRLQLEINADGRKLVLENVLDHLWQVFSVTRLDRLVEIREPISA